LILIWSPQ